MDRLLTNLRSINLATIVATVAGQKNNFSLAIAWGKTESGP
ncbi:hypothetical protein NON20_11090 [Synechocystis sp. B12]|nr:MULTISPECIES: hypothetical protein [unclassified Synechocystis]WLT39862.1 hypothetical protein NON20_11090 [Synechocystis sp. B12]